MSNIPADIRKIAEAVVDRGYNVGLIEAVSAALLAEREAQQERDAKIVEEWEKTLVPGEFLDEAFRNVAAAIREGSKP